MSSYVSKKNISIQSSHVFLFLILSFSFACRFYRLSVPEHEYFDEVYYAFTAKKIVEGDSKVWEWWNSAPEGFAYEWVHPPLSKIIMAGSMLVFGKNSLAWRLPSAVLGVLVIFLIYLIGVFMFSQSVGLLAALIFSLDGLPLVLSRIGMIDIYVLFFCLLCFYLFLKDSFFYSAVCLGCSLASKWSAVWIIPILVMTIFVYKKSLTKNLFWFVIVPPLIYLVSYFLLFFAKHDFAHFVQLQQNMFKFHANLDASHPYASSSWSWPLLLRPIYLYTSGIMGGVVANIYAMGNPFVFWLGALSILVCSVIWIAQKNKNLFLIVFSYFIFFVPWALSPRIMFLYHYVPSVAFMSIALAYVLDRYPRLRVPFFVIAFILFVYFFPHWTGLEIPVWLDQSYYWLASWR